MDLQYSDNARTGEFFPLLRQASTRLEDLLGPSAGTTRAEWDLTPDAEGRPLYTLRVSGLKESAAAQFAPDELADSPHLRHRLTRLWGDMLQARNHRHLREMQGTGGGA